MGVRMDRLGMGADVVVTTAGPEPRPIVEWVLSLGRRLERLRPGDARHLAALLDQNGLTGRVSPTELMVLKALGAVAAIGFVVAAQPLFPQDASLNRLLVAPVVVVAWFLPELYLLNRRKRYRASVAQTLPTLTDLLLMSLDAGMGVERALRLITERVDSPISAEFRRVLADIDLGVSRRDAFRRMAERVSLDELHALASAIIQADELGSNLTASMKIHTREIRLSRRRAAEAAAVKAPVKMIFPMVIFLLPALCLVLFSPLIIQFLGGGL